MTLPVEPEQFPDVPVERQRELMRRVPALLAAFWRGDEPTIVHLLADIEETQEAAFFIVVQNAMMGSFLEILQGVLQRPGIEILDDVMLAMLLADED